MKKKRNCSYLGIISISIMIALIATFVFSALFTTMVNSEKITIGNLDLYAHIIRTLGVILSFVVLSRFYTGLRYIAISAAIYIIVLLVMAYLFCEGLSGDVPVGIGITAINVLLFGILQKKSAKERGARGVKKRTG